MTKLGMLESFIITFRETLEAALVIGIILGYLSRTEQTSHNRLVYYGIGAAIAASLAVAFIFDNVAGGFTGRAEEIFEGITMLVASILLTTMILWMMQQKQIALKLEQKVEQTISKARELGLFALVFIAILREGVETVIFLAAVGLVSGSSMFIGSATGIGGAVILAYLLFAGTRKVNLKLFFNGTSFILILFAAGLLAHGVHELQEAHVIPVISEHVWDINPEVISEDQYPLMHEKGYVGSFLKSLLGYNGNPSLIETLSYIAYLLLAFGLWVVIDRRK